jgi:predicted chitinase
MINRDKFYRTVQRGPFPGSIAITQREGMEVILTEWEKRRLTELSWLAYMLATAFHETAHTMQPVIETFNAARDKTNPSVETAIARLDAAWAAGRLKWVKSPYWRKDANGMSWLGRGFVQLTHKFNYVTAQRKLGLPFSTRPEIALQVAPACQVMFQGMIEGWFTSHKLAEFRKPDGTFHFVKARMIINGLDRAEEIAGHARQFHAALVAAADDRVTPSLPPPDVEPPQPQPQAPPAPSLPPGKTTGILALLAGWGLTVWNFILEYPELIALGTIALGLLITAIIKFAHRKKES